MWNSLSDKLIALGSFLAFFGIFPLLEILGEAEQSCGWQNLDLGVKIP